MIIEILLNTKKTEALGMKLQKILKKLIWILNRETKLKISWNTKKRVEKSIKMLGMKEIVPQMVMIMTEKIVTKKLNQL